MINQLLNLMGKLILTYRFIFSATQEKRIIDAIPTLIIAGVVSAIFEASFPSTPDEKIANLDRSLGIYAFKLNSDWVFNIFEESTLC